MKYIMISLILFMFSSNLYAEKKLFVSCSKAKDELVDLEKDSNNGYEKNNLEADIFYDDKTKKFYLNYETELFFLDNLDMGARVIQFLEPILSGHYALYTLHKDSLILTIQKSYNLKGSIMVNIYYKCKTP